MRRSLVLALVLLGGSARLLGQVGQREPATDPSPHRVGVVTVSGLRVPFLDWGGNGPCLVFVAGLGNSAQVFDDFAPRFTNRFRVLAVTHTGFGESDQPERDGYDLDSRVAHIRAALDTAGISKAVLIGHSLVLAERERFARVAIRAQIAAYRAHHYLFLSHPDETETRIRAFLSSLER
jgi:non-heme chloroperoxidase